MLSTDIFRTVLGSTSQGSDWNGSLARFFSFCRELVTQLRAEARAGQLESRVCVTAHVESAFKRDLARLVEKYYLQTESPFEGVASISGGIWSAQDLFGGDRDDAVLKLHFAPNTTDLPIHSHDHSDRVVVCAGGNGEFQAVKTATQEDRSVQRVPVGVGDLIAFTRGVEHTFQASEHGLLLLSYHSPFLPLDDPRQFTIASWDAYQDV